jgi:hypothetical protein
MDLGDVGPRYLGHPVIAERRDNHTLQHAPVAFGRARLKTERDVLLLETVGELLDGDCLPTGLAPGSRIIAIPGGRDDGDPFTRSRSMLKSGFPAFESGWFLK